MGSLGGRASIAKNSGLVLFVFFAVLLSFSTHRSTQIDPDGALPYSYIQRTWLLGIRSVNRAANERPASAQNKFARLPALSDFSHQTFFWRGRPRGLFPASAG